MITRADCEAMDCADPLAAVRDAFALPDGVIYLDGNSLGALARATLPHVQDVVASQWGRDLIGSWNTHDWIGAPARVGARIAPLIGAAADEVLVADTTSINLYKLAAGALSLRPGRRVIVSEAGNFPTDVYMLQGLRQLLGDVELRIVAPENVVAALDESTALLVLSHVHYKSGRRWDVAALTNAAHAVGALALWDVAHSAGAIAVRLNDCNADLAVGCGYKFLNGGPGAPAFLFVARRHQDAIVSPLTGWLGHAEPFAFSDEFLPAKGVRRMLCSSPSILATAALEAGLSVWDGIELTAVENKAGRLGDLFIGCVEQRCDAFCVHLESPRAAAERGAQVSFSHPDGYAVMQALIARKVIGDFRAPDLLRFGFAPLTTRYADAYDAARVLHETLLEEVQLAPQFRGRSAVT